MLTLTVNGDPVLPSSCARSRGRNATTSNYRVRCVRLAYRFSRMKAAWQPRITTEARARATVPRIRPCECTGLGVYVYVNATRTRGPITAGYREWKVHGGVYAPQA